MDSDCSGETRLCFLRLDLSAFFDGTAATAMKTVPDPSTERAAAAYDAAVAAAAESSAATEV